MRKSLLKRKKKRVPVGRSAGLPIPSQHNILNETGLRFADGEVNPSFLWGLLVFMRKARKGIPVITSGWVYRS